MNERQFEQDVESMIPARARLLQMTEAERRAELETITANTNSKITLKNDTSNDYWDSVIEEADLRIQTRQLNKASL